MRDVSYMAHSDELYHKAGFKYIKKYYKDGKPVYVYADKNMHAIVKKAEKSVETITNMRDHDAKKLANAKQFERESKDRKMRAEQLYGPKNTNYYVTNAVNAIYDDAKRESRVYSTLYKDDTEMLRDAKEYYDKRLSENSVSAEAKRITDSVKSKTKSLLDKIKSAGSSTVSSLKSGTSNLLNKGKSALSKLFETKTKQTTIFGTSVVTTRDASGNVIDKSYYNNPVAIIRNDDRGGLSKIARKSGLTVGEPPSSIPQNPSDAARTRISQRNTFAKRAARTGPTEPSRGVDDEYAKELASNSRKNAITNEPREVVTRRQITVDDVEKAYKQGKISKEYLDEFKDNTTGAGSSRATTTNNERTVEDVRELYRQGKVSKEYLEEFEANARKYR